MDVSVEIDDEANSALETVEAGRQELVSAARHSLETLQRQLRRYEAAVRRSVRSLLAPELPDVDGSLAVLPNDQISPPTATAKNILVQSTDTGLLDRNSTCVGAELAWKCTTQSHWLMAVRVTNRSRHDLPAPKLLLHCDRGVDYTTRTWQLPFLPPDGSGVGRVASQLFAAQSAMVCAVVNISDWTQDMTVRVLLSGCVPPFDAYHTFVGEYALTLDERLNGSNCCENQLSEDPAALAEALYATSHVIRRVTMPCDVTSWHVRCCLERRRFVTSHDERVWVCGGESSGAAPLSGTLVCALQRQQLVVFTTTAAQMALMSRVLCQLAPEATFSDNDDGCPSLLSALRHECAVLSRHICNEQQSHAPVLPSIGRRSDIVIDGADYCKWRLSLLEAQLDVVRATSTIL